MAEIKSIIYNKDKFENCAKFFDDTDSPIEHMIKFGDLQESAELPTLSDSLPQTLKI